MVSLISRVETSHRDMIHDAQMDYYGTRLATCSSDRSVKVFDVKPNGQQQLVGDLIGHEGPVWQVSWSHPMYGSLLASCSYDRRVIIWKEVQGRWNKVHEYKNHESSVNSVCWAPHEYGTLLAAGSSDGTISLIWTSGDGSWNDKKILQAHAIGCNSVSWCPAIAPGALLDPQKQQPAVITKRLVSGGCDNLVKIWKYKEDDQSWVEEHKLEGHKDWVRDAAWAPSVGLSQSTIASCSQDHRVIIWRTPDLDNGRWSSQILHVFDDVVWHVSWSVCGSILAISCGDNKGSSSVIYTHHNTGVRSLKWFRQLEYLLICKEGSMSRDGRPVAKGVSGTVKWFDVQKGFGFISRGDNGDDCFAHRTAIAAKNPNHYDASLAEGEEVEFDVIQGQKGMEASNITGPRGGPVRGNDQAASGGGGGYGGGRSFGGGGRGGGGYGGGGYGGGGGGGYGGGRGGGRGGYGGGGRGGGGGGGDGCFKCGEQGHFARECPNSGGGGGGRY